MKRILFTALGAGMLLTSCQSDELMPGGIGSEQEVAFTVSLPDVASTRAGSVNSAKGGVSNNVGEEVTFHVALYLDGHQVYDAKETVASTGNHTSATFKPTLVIGEEYNVVAFAEFDADEDDASLKAVAVERGINNEKNDDYFVSQLVTAAPQLSAELKRPYGKLRLLADDLREAERQFNSVIKNVSVTYKETRPTVFNAVTGDFNDYADGDQTFEAAYTEYEEGSITVNDALENEGVGNLDDDYDTIFVDYIPAAADASDQMMPFSITVTFEDGNTYTRVFPQDIPIRRNWLTTLKGNLFTMDSELTLIIEENFDGETTDIYHEDVEWVLANGGTITLQNDVVVDRTLYVGGNAMLNLNGHSIINKSTNETTDVIFVKEGAELTINGEGTIEAVSGNDGYAVVSEGKLTINGGTFKSGVDADGQANAVVYARANGKIYINGGTFEKSEGASTFILNKKDADRATTVIEVRGGKYKDFNPADNAAEGQHTNFVVEGYEVTNIGGYYIVKPEGQDIVMYDTYAEVGSAEGLLKWAWHVNNQDLDYGLVLIDNIYMPEYEVVVDDANKTYRFTDTAITVTDGKPSGSNWISVGFAAANTWYNGKINGNDYTIYGLRINETADYCGFVDYQRDGGEIKNIKFDNAILYSTSQCVGVAAGRSQDGTLIENVHVTNSQVHGSSYVGGIVGYNYRRKGGSNNYNEKLAYTVNCSTDENTVVKGSETVGGICGINYGAVILNCVNNADVTGSTNVGGVAGYAREYWTNVNGYVIASGSTNKATITATKGNAGGVIGQSLWDFDNHKTGGNYIVACYSQSALSGKTIGNIIGSSNNSTIISSWGNSNSAKIYGDGDTYSLVATYIFSSVDAITVEQVDAMNAAIAEYNATAGVEQTCPFTWNWTLGSWPVLR